MTPLIDYAPPIRTGYARGDRRQAVRRDRRRNPGPPACVIGCNRLRWQLRRLASWLFKDTPSWN